MKNWMNAGVIGIAAQLATNAEAGGYVEGRLAGSHLEVDVLGDTLEIDSFGVEGRAAVDLGSRFGLRGSVLAVTSDEASFEGETADVDTSMTIVRLGPTFRFTDLGASTEFYGVVEFATLTVEVEGDDSSDSGFDLALGFRDKGNRKFLWDAEIGYVSIQDTKGAVIQGTVGYRFNPHFALTGGVQGYGLEDEDDSEISLGSATVGARFTF